MNRHKSLGRAGGLAATAIAAAPFAWLWAQQMHGASEPVTAEVRLDMAKWMAVFGAPSMIAAWLLWRAWWRQAGTKLSRMDGPALLVAAVAATLPAERRDWGRAMAAELAQVQGRAARRRFALGCARAACFPLRGSRAVVDVVGALAVAAIVTSALATGAVLPAGRVFAMTFVGLLGGLATLAAARSRRLDLAGPGRTVAGLALAGIVVCIAFTTYYLARFPTHLRLHPPATASSLPPVTAVVLALLLAGCLWLALRPPRWLLPDRHARRFGIAMAVVLVGGFVAVVRSKQPDGTWESGVMDYLLAAPVLVLLPGSTAAAAVGRSLRSGLWASAWATVLATPLIIAAWLAEALRWYEQGRGLLLDGTGGLGIGANLGDAIWWPLVFLVLWALPIGMLGAAAGSARARRRRARERAPAAA